jgi:hypothetical protein
VRNASRLWPINEETTIAVTPKSAMAPERNSDQVRWLRAVLRIGFGKTRRRSGGVDIVPSSSSSTSPKQRLGKLPRATRIR